MSTTIVSICNQAISWLGGSLITTLDDDSTEAKLCKANYEELRDAVLEEKAWTFATTRVELAKKSTAPAYGFSVAFAVPSDAITVLQCSPDVSGISGPGPSRDSLRLGDELRFIWQREEDSIVCDADAVFCRYIKRITDVTKFSPGFKQALAARIAWDIANPLTHSKTLEEKMEKKYTRAISVGGTSDGLQGRSTKIRSDALTRVR